MNRQISYEVSIEVFGSTDRWTPNIRVRSFPSNSQPGSCTCAEIIHRQLRASNWADPFTQRVLCLSSASLGEMFRHLQENPDDVIAFASSDEQKRIMFELKQLCECDQQSSPPTSSEHANEHGLLDRTLLDSEHSFQSRPPTAAPVAMTYDQILRPAPQVLQLARLRTEAELQKGVNDEVSRTMMAKLKTVEHDDKPGHVYMMQRDSAPGYIKIGFSRKHVAIRNDKLQHCFGDLRVLAHTNMIPNAAKVERMVHAELSYFRRWQDCGMCGGSHIEWFEIDADIAKKVILRWAQWIVGEPYERLNGKLKGHWYKKVAENKEKNIVVMVQKYVESRMTKGSLRITQTESPVFEQLRRTMHEVVIVDVEKDESFFYTSDRRSRKRKRSS